MKNSKIIVIVTCIALLSLLPLSIAFHQLFIPVVMTLISLLGLVFIFMGNKEKSFFAGLFLEAAGMLFIYEAVLGGMIAFNMGLVASILQDLFYIALFCLYVVCMVLAWIFFLRFHKWLRKKNFASHADEEDN